MENKEIYLGATYPHKTLGRVSLLTVHPHDGASLIIEDCDDAAIHICERDDLIAYVEQDRFPNPFTKRLSEFLACNDHLEKIEHRVKELEAVIAEAGKPSFQSRVEPWLIACFGEEISNDKSERNHRFLEESLELVQSTGCTASEAHQLVDYVFNRPVGDPPQEVGGVMVTLAALCRANELDMHANGETELARIWTKVEKIRAKQAAKPKHSPLPEHTDTKPDHASAARIKYLESEVKFRDEMIATLADQVRPLEQRNAKGGA